MQLKLTWNLEDWYFIVCWLSIRWKLHNRQENYTSCTDLIAALTQRKLIWNRNLHGWPVALIRCLLFGEFHFADRWLWGDSEWLTLCNEFVHLWQVKHATLISNWICSTDVDNDSHTREFCRTSFIARGIMQMITRCTQESSKVSLKYACFDSIINKTARWWVQSFLQFGARKVGEDLKNKMEF